MESQTPYYRVTLKNALAERIQKNSSYSLRSFAAALKIEPSALSKIISGKRFLTEKMAKRFFAILDLNPEEEARFLYSIAKSKSSQGVGRMSPALKKALAKPPVKTERRELTGDLFRVISDWYHTAILELTLVDGFVAEPRWIAKQLKISVTEAQLALDRLHELELLEEKNGKIVKSEQWIDTADKSVTSTAHKRRQKQILEKSMQSLQEDDITLRSHSAMTIPIDPKKIPLAKKRIQKFMWALAKELSADNKEEVYEMIVNLIPLTQINQKSGVQK